MDPANDYGREGIKRGREKGRRRKNEENRARLSSEDIWKILKSSAAVYSDLVWGNLW
ncbi:unnamed protein product [Gongylonema pulchrum]|uniref:Uncharacterized protein n=1 Tax=Gongylonema pulchrum TaxID=637853 RepID=A0A183DI54_9BILA|nr:unnamed protein product [Gongylonema pulchrum]